MDVRAYMCMRMLRECLRMSVLVYTPCTCVRIERTEEWKRECCGCCRSGGLIQWVLMLINNYCCAFVAVVLFLLRILTNSSRLLWLLACRSRLVQDHAHSFSLSLSPPSPSVQGCHVTTDSDRESMISSAARSRTYARSEDSSSTSAVSVGRILTCSSPLKYRHQCLWPATFVSSLSTRQPALDSFNLGTMIWRPPLDRHAHRRARSGSQASLRSWLERALKVGGSGVHTPGSVCKVRCSVNGSPASSLCSMVFPHRAPVASYPPSTSAACDTSPILVFASLNAKRQVSLSP